MVFSWRASGDLTHLRRARNFMIENKFSSESFLANCHWQFSPKHPFGVSGVQISLTLPTKKPTRRWTV